MRLGDFRLWGISRSSTKQGRCDVHLFLGSLTLNPSRSGLHRVNVHNSAILLQEIERRRNRTAPLSSEYLLKQLEYKLLLLVGLGQRGNTGLFQDGVLRQGGHRRWNIGGADTVFCTRQILHLVGDDVCGAL